MRPYRKRKLHFEPEPTSLPLPTAKRRKPQNQQRNQTPSSFWDNLSQQWLTRRTLREFDRRTVWPALPVPPSQTDEVNIDLVELKRFARHGGLSLGDIRGVRTVKWPIRGSHSDVNPVPES